MKQTLMKGLNERDMGAVISNYNLNDFYYPTLFPLEKKSQLTWKTLESKVGLHIAGDLVARGASLDRKTREALAELRGDIPKIGIRRDMDENELEEYDTAVALAQDSADLAELVRYWADDTKFCFDGVAARLEWIALQIISKGKLVLTNANNQSVITEYNVDYDIPANHKSGFATGSAAWTSTSSAKPISKDFRGIIEAAKREGISLKYAFMNPATFADFCATEEVIKNSASYAQNLMGIAYEPDLATVNQALAKKPYLNGLQIIVLDQQVTIEINGQLTTVNPFENNVVMFSESKVLGNTYWKTPADMKVQGSAAIRVMQGHTCIKKYSVEDPAILEVTQAIANAIPVWKGSTRSFLMKTDANTWNL